MKKILALAVTGLIASMGSTAVLANDGYNDCKKVVLEKLILRPGGFNFDWTPDLPNKTRPLSGPDVKVIVWARGDVNEEDEFVRMVVRHGDDDPVRHNLSFMYDDCGDNDRTNNELECSTYDPDNVEREKVYLNFYKDSDDRYKTTNFRFRLNRNFNASWAVIKAVKVCTKGDPS